jgi:hypothetical protein
MTNGPDPPSNPQLELPKLQFDYAWKWFSYHADQRVKMFNFMLIVLGIFATAIVSAVGNKELPIGFAAVLCFVAAALALIFPLLDRRNRDLVWLGEELLTHLEKTVIFGEGITIKDRRGRDVRFGILSRQSFEDDVRANNLWSAWFRGGQDVWRALTSWRVWGERVDYAWRGRHRVWLPWISILMFALFFAAGIWILKHPPH